jgi:hypothetical protein
MICHKNRNGLPATPRGFHWQKPEINCFKDDEFKFFPLMVFKHPVCHFSGQFDCHKKSLYNVCLPKAGLDFLGASQDSTYYFIIPQPLYIYQDLVIPNTN